MAPPSNFTLMAHRGFSSQYPENTAVAFQAAVQAGFPHIELDVQLTGDGIPVVRLLACLATSHQGTYLMGR